MIKVICIEDYYELYSTLAELPVDIEKCFRGEIYECNYNYIHYPSNGISIFRDADELDIYVGFFEKEYFITLAEYEEKQRKIEWCNKQINDLLDDN